MLFSCSGSFKTFFSLKKRISFVFSNEKIEPKTKKFSSKQSNIKYYLFNLEKQKAKLNIIFNVFVF